MYAKLLPSCPALCGPMDCRSPGPWILQAETQKWDAMPSSRGSSPGIAPTSLAAPASQADSLLLSHWGSPYITHRYK